MLKNADRHLERVIHRTIWIADLSRHDYATQYDFAVRTLYQGALIMTHRDRAGEPPAGVGKPRRCPAGPAASLLLARWPDGSPARSLWVIISAPWYYPG